MGELGISLWSVFFLVPTGRARAEDVASPEEFEWVFHRMYDLSQTAPFDIKSTAAPQYRRVVLQRQVEERRAGERDADARARSRRGWASASPTGWGGRRG